VVLVGVSPAQIDQTKEEMNIICRTLWGIVDGKFKPLTRKKYSLGQGLASVAYRKLDPLVLALANGMLENHYSHVPQPCSALSL
jgi:hypothetical protein